MEEVVEEKKPFPPSTLLSSSVRLITVTLLFSFLSVPLYRRGNKASDSIFLLCACRKSSSPRSIASCHSGGTRLSLRCCDCQNSCLCDSTSAIALSKWFFIAILLSPVSIWLFAPRPAPVESSQLRQGQFFGDGQGLPSAGRSRST